MFWLTTKCKYNKLLIEKECLEFEVEELKKRVAELSEMNYKLRGELEIEKKKVKSGFQKGNKPWNKGYRFYGEKQCKKNAKETT